MRTGRMSGTRRSRPSSCCSLKCWSSVSLRVSYSVPPIFYAGRAEYPPAFFKLVKKLYHTIFHYAIGIFAADTIQIFAADTIRENSPCMSAPAEEYTVKTTVKPIPKGAFHVIIRHLARRAHPDYHLSHLCRSPGGPLLRALPFSFAGAPGQRGRQRRLCSLLLCRRPYCR